MPLAARSDRPFTGLDTPEYASGVDLANDLIDTAPARVIDVLAEAELALSTHGLSVVQEARTRGFRDTLREYLTEKGN